MMLLNMLSELSIYDLTGILVLNPKTQSYEIEKQPDQEEVYEHLH